MTTAVTIDVAGGQVGGAARYRTELLEYLKRRPRQDVTVIGGRRGLTPAWLAAREISAVRRSRRVALNNVGFFIPGGERWTLLGNALHFLSEPEEAALNQAQRTAAARQAWLVRQAASRSDVLVAPCTSMADRIAAALPHAADRIVVRMHPVSVTAPARLPDEPVILCPVLFASHKDMSGRVADWLAAVDGTMDDSVRMIVTASAAELPDFLAASPRLRLAGRLSVRQVQGLWSGCRAVYFPTGIESFGYPLAEARAAGLAVIARDTPQNREIAGPALCGYRQGDRESLRAATEAALSLRIAPDPDPFDPDAYFDWMLGGVK